MDWFYDFISDNAGTIGGIVTAAVVLIIIVAWVDKHPKQKDVPTQNEPRRDDE